MDRTVGGRGGRGRNIRNNTERWAGNKNPLGDTNRDTVRRYVRREIRSKKGEMWGHSHQVAKFELIRIKIVLDRTRDHILKRHSKKLIPRCNKWNSFEKNIRENLRKERLRLHEGGLVGKIRTSSAVAKKKSKGLRGVERGQMHPALQNQENNKRTKGPVSLERGGGGN